MCTVFHNRIASDLEQSGQWHDKKSQAVMRWEESKRREMEKRL